MLSRGVMRIASQRPNGYSRRRKPMFEAGCFSPARSGMPAASISSSASELESGLVEVIAVEVGVAERVDEVPGRQAGLLGHDHREQGVGRDVEGDAEEDVGAALVELAVEVCRGLA